MSWRYVVREANGTRRRVEASAFPLSVGGPDAEIPVAGAQTQEPLAHLGLSSDEVFVQAASGTVRVNGTPVKTSQWLRDGDVIVNLGRVRVRNLDDLTEALQDYQPGSTVRAHREGRTQIVSSD